MSQDRDFFIAQGLLVPLLFLGV